MMDSVLHFVFVEATVRTSPSKWNALEMTTTPKDRYLTAITTFFTVPAVLPHITLNLRHGPFLCTHSAQAVCPDHPCPYSSAGSNAMPGAVHRGLGISILQADTGTYVYLLLRDSTLKCAYWITSWSRKTTERKQRSVQASVIVVGIGSTRIINDQSNMETDYRISQCLQPQCRQYSPLPRLFFHAFLNEV